MALRLTNQEAAVKEASASSPFRIQNQEVVMNTQEYRISDEDAAWRGVHEPVGSQVLNAAMNTWNAVKFMAGIVADHVKYEAAETFNRENE